MLARGEPAPARRTLGGAHRSPGISNSVPEYNWEGTAALSAAGKDLTGVRQRNSHRAPPPRVLCFCMTRHATSRVTFCHAKTKS